MSTTELSSAGSAPVLPSNPHHVAKPLLLALSFLGGFQVMALEVCGLRILQMNLGSSVIVTGTLLTTIMIVLSVGYYLGGALRLLHSPRALFVMLLGACAYTQFSSVILLDHVGELALDLSDALDRHELLAVGLPAAFVSLLLYGPPVLALSTISPCLIRYQSASPSSDAGKQSGFIMSLSTAGSIFGTLLASYVLIPSLGVRATAAGTNAVFVLLLAVALVSSARAGRRLLLGVTTIVGAVALASLPVARSQEESKVLHDSESLYGRVRVISATDARGRDFLAYESTRAYWHSVTYPDDPLRELPGSIYLAAGLVENAKSMLVLGSAAGGSIRQAQLLMPQLEITGVDIDPAVHAVATNYFRVDPKRVRLVSRDARQFLEREQARYDFIVVDTFAGEFMPAHCITREYFSRLKQRLNPGGVVFINTNMFDVPFELPEGTREPVRVSRHLERTLRDVGFATLFENKFFHSLVLYPQPVPLEAFRAKLLAAAQDPNRPLATRAGLGLMARTTVDARQYPREYEPFSDAWAPEIVLELKSNHARLYDALGKAPRVDAGLTPAVRVIRDRLLAERAQGSRSGAIADAAALVRELDRIEAPLSPEDARLAARYLRFDDVPLPQLEAHSPWARLAAGYARMYDAAHANDYEALATILTELH
jgi:predicted O-methyltransferase YrrM